MQLNAQRAVGELQEFGLIAAVGIAICSALTRLEKKSLPHIGFYPRCSRSSRLLVSVHLSVTELSVFLTIVVWTVMPLISSFFFWLRRNCESSWRLWIGIFSDGAHLAVTDIICIVHVLSVSSRWATFDDRLTGFLSRGIGNLSTESKLIPTLGDCEVALND
ncbi:hypothetical protein MVEN_02309400 [Mycena venus]|uniref:Uncharacterized protein n=1 Tax=Mycena venus TaxID=2733690 RepID=A0A8H6X4U2_9AGAR|nr:hypothetical protein MVEN_02309400 [Mycena venus]